MKILINNEEVVCDKNISIKEEMLNTTSTILNNCYPKSWENTKNYTDNYYYPKDYSKCLIYNENDELIFCGVVKNTGNINLNPRYPHYANLQVLDFKTFLSEGDTFDFVISGKTITEAIEMIIEKVKGYGVIKGNIEILNPNEEIGAYSTLNKTAYDCFNYLADISQSRWFTRLVDEDTIAIDFYDPSLMTLGNDLDYNQINCSIKDISYSYSTQDYRNKQIMTSKEIYADTNRIETKFADGYNTTFLLENNIYTIQTILVDGVSKDYATIEDKNLGIIADFYYRSGGNELVSNETYTAGTNITISYIPIIEGRQVIYNDDEILRISNSTNRNGIISRYENRNDAITSEELLKVGQSYIKYKGSPETIIKVETHNNNLWNVGEVVNALNMPIEELNRDYMVKSKQIDMIVNTGDIFYIFELSSSYNSENAINYFDNQRNKARGNLKAGEYISRNIDIENTATIIFTDVNAEEIAGVGNNVLNAGLNSPFVE